MLRTTTLTQTQSILEHLRESNARHQQVVDKIASGVRVNRPSDSPIDAASIVRLNSALEGLGQFRENLESVQSELQSVDGSLFAAIDVLNRAATLAAQASNGTQEPATLTAIKGEVDVIFQHLVSVANTTHGDTYLFGGRQNLTSPFEIDDTQPFGVRYLGDSSHRVVTFPNRRDAQISLSGSELFLTPDKFIGAGRTAVTSPSPSPPIGVGVAFSGDVDGVISADLVGPFVATVPTGGAAAGDTVTVSFTATDGTIAASIITDPLLGGETTADIATLLNTQIAASPELAGKVSFSDDGGFLKLTVDEFADVGFNFTSISGGSVTSGLESGGEAGGYSAGEIAAALNLQILSNPALNQAGVRFTAVNGEVELDSNVDIEFTAVDFDRGTAFASGLEGSQRVGGRSSANVLGVINQLRNDLEANDTDAILQRVADVRRTIEHLGRAQAFYGATQRQIQVTLQTIRDSVTIDRQQLSEHRDTDIVSAIEELSRATTARDTAVQLAARERRTVLDLIG